MLEESVLKSLEQPEKSYKLFDGRGLYLVVNPSGRHWWRFKYRFDRSEKHLALGVYPDVRLSSARKKRDDARRLIAEENIDPGAKRRAEKRARLIAQADTFRAVAEEWLESGCPGSKRTKGRPSEETVRQLRLRLTKYVYPRIGRMPIVDVRLGDLRAVLTPIGSQGKHETAHRVRSLCERIYRYAIATERAERNIAADLNGMLAVIETKGFAAITEAKPFGRLIKA